MVGVYIFLTIVVTLQIVLIVLQFVSGNVLLNLANQLKDITMGLSVVLDRTGSMDQQRSANNSNAGLIDVTTPQTSYDPRFDGLVDVEEP